MLVLAGGGPLGLLLSLYISCFVFLLALACVCFFTHFFVCFVFP